MKRVERAFRERYRKLLSDSRSIKGIAPPVSSRKKDLTRLVRSISDLRGRSMFYDSITSGAGKGPYVQLMDGSVKIDFITGIGVHLFGHAHPDLLAASVSAALNDTAIQGNLMMDKTLIEFVENLMKHVRRTSRLHHCFVSNSGAMANENALKILRQSDPKRKHLIAFSHCFHGRTQTMAQLTDNPALKQGLPVGKWCHYIPFYNKEAGWDTQRVVGELKKVLRKNKSCAIIMEPVQGEGGYLSAPKSFFNAIISECRKNGVKIWLDEIQTSGRTRTLFVFESLGLGKKIDVVTSGKMLHCAVTLFTDELNPKPGLLSQTFAGATAALAAGTETIRLLKSGGYFGAGGRNLRHANYLRSRLNDLALRKEGKVSSISGFDGMIAFRIGSGTKEEAVNVVKKLFDAGLMVFYCGHGPYSVRMLPPMGVLDTRVIDEAMEVIEDVV